MEYCVSFKVVVLQVKHRFENGCCLLWIELTRGSQDFYFVYACVYVYFLWAWTCEEHVVWGWKKKKKKKADTILGFSVARSYSSRPGIWRIRYFPCVILLHWDNLSPRRHSSRINHVGLHMEPVIWRTSILIVDRACFPALAFCMISDGIRGAVWRELPGSVERWREHRHGYGTLLEGGLMG